MRYKNNTDPKIQKYLHFITDANDRMRKMIKDLLAFSRAGRQLDIDPRVNIEDVVNEVIGMMQNKIESSKAIIKTSDLNIRVPYDRDKLVRVIQNLLSNSIKFSHPDRKPEINISVNGDGPYIVRVSISDNGQGINEESKIRIFNMFERSGATIGSGEGSGIGLAICKRIIEKHGGKIWVESKPGVGSDFAFTILQQQYD